ncbi:MAG: GGDEF domain-containing protein [Proteobacteria bacterium]|nr:GGDEF domain-containing protein [Pseudomonadota bacterium]
MYAVGVLTVLTGFLLCAGLLMYGISRRLSLPQGLDAIALGGVLMGLGFGLQLLFPERQLNPMVVINHTATVMAMVGFLVGMMRFLGLRSPGWRTQVALALLYTVLQVLVDRELGMTARYLLLAGTATGLYALLCGVLAWGGLQPRARDVRLGLLTLSVLAFSIGALNVAKGYLLVRHGMQALNMDSLFQQVFYTVVAVAVAVMTPALLWMVFSRLSALLTTLATTDALTGVLNRAGLNERLAAHWATGTRVPAMLMMVDVDHFKSVNDRHGHPVGDEVLRRVAFALRDNLRQRDLIARAGGEEFIIVCLDASEHGTLSLAERLREAVSRESLVVDGALGATLRWTVSIGVSRGFHDMAGFERAVDQADRAMYRGKGAGRNQVHGVEGVFVPTPPPSNPPSVLH